MKQIFGYYVKIGKERIGLKNALFAQLKYLLKCSSLYACKQLINVLKLPSIICCIDWSVMAYFRVLIPFVVPPDQTRLPSCERTFLKLKLQYRVFVKYTNAPFPIRLQKYGRALENFICIFDCLDRKLELVLIGRHMSIISACM